MNLDKLANLKAMEHLEKSSEINWRDLAIGGALGAGGLYGIQKLLEPAEKEENPSAYYEYPMYASVPQGQVDFSPEMYSLYAMEDYPELYGAYDDLYGAYQGNSGSNYDDIYGDTYNAYDSLYYQ